MGEIADDMLNGNTCEACGVWIGENSGIPMYCSLVCAESRGAGIDQVVGNEDLEEEDE